MGTIAIDRLQSAPTTEPRHSSRIMAFVSNLQARDSISEAVFAYDATAVVSFDRQVIIENLGSAVSPDLLILEVDMSEIQTLRLLTLVRSHNRAVPILILSEQRDRHARIAALKAGADVLLTGPIAADELIAHIEVVLRRHQYCSPNVAAVGELTLFRDERRAERNGRRITLTAKEYSILDYMIRSPGQPVSRSELLVKLWGMPPNTNSNVVDVYINYLRAKIEDPGERKLIHTVRGFGYEIRA